MPRDLPTGVLRQSDLVGEGDPVKLSAGETLDGIDASIEGTAERGVREYLENRSEAQPTGSSTSTLPGAIEPLPANKKLEEEFWAHPPWHRSTPSAAAAAWRWRPAGRL